MVEISWRIFTAVCAAAAFSSGSVDWFAGGILFGCEGSMSSLCRGWKWGLYYIPAAIWADRRASFPNRQWLAPNVDMGHGGEREQAIHAEHIVNLWMLRITS
jgi:hypothetical protein